MMQISDVIIATPILPTRFVSGDYDRFLLFDFSLRSEFSLLDEIQGPAGTGSKIQLFYAQSLELLGAADNSESWSEKISRIDQSLAQRGEPYGIIIAESNADWLLAQHSPVEWGIFAFKSTSPSALNVLNSLNIDDFLSVDDFRNAIHDNNSRLHEFFDREFIDKIVENF